jgi:hypothetical protein
MKNSVASEKRTRGVRVAVAVLGSATAVLLGACATLPTEQVSETLDPDTAITVTTLSRPIELVSQNNNRGKQTDPFAYIAPFETNRMGAKELFLWVSTPQAQGQLTEPQVICNGQQINLQPLSTDSDALGARGAPGDNVTGGTGSAPVKVDLSKLNMSRAPYEAPVPWSTQWYFKLPADSLKCLADAEGIVLEARAADGSAEQFTSSGGRKSLASLDAFTRR